MSALSDLLVNPAGKLKGSPHSTRGKSRKGKNPSRDKNPITGLKSGAFDAAWKTRRGEKTGSEKPRVPELARAHREGEPAKNAEGPNRSNSVTAWAPGISQGTHHARDNGGKGAVEADGGGGTLLSFWRQGRPAVQRTGAGARRNPPAEALPDAVAEEPRRLGESVAATVNKKQAVQQFRGLRSIG